MFYVIKDEKLYEYGDRISAGWNCPQEAKELSGITMEEFEANKGKFEIQGGVLADISSTEAYIAASQAEQKEAHIEEIKSQLNALDLKCIRAMREGGSDENGIPYLDIYQQEINTLRTQLNSPE